MGVPLVTILVRHICPKRAPNHHRWIQRHEHGRPRSRHIAPPPHFFFNQCADFSMPLDHFLHASKADRTAQCALLHLPSIPDQAACGGYILEDGEDHTWYMIECMAKFLEKSRISTYIQSIDKIKPSAYYWR